MNLQMSGEGENFKVLVRGGCAEAIGVFLFVFTGCGAAISAGGGLYPIAFAVRVPNSRSCLDQCFSIGLETHASINPARITCKLRGCVSLAAATGRCIIVLHIVPGAVRPRD